MSTSFEEQEGWSGDFEFDTEMAESEEAETEWESEFHRRPRPWRRAVRTAPPWRSGAVRPPWRPGAVRPPRRYGAASQPWRPGAARPPWQYGAAPRPLRYGTALQPWRFGTTQPLQSASFRPWWRRPRWPRRPFYFRTTLPRSGGWLGTAEPPIDEPPIDEPAFAEPPFAQPIVGEPVVAEPPVAEPPVTEPPAGAATAGMPSDGAPPSAEFDLRPEPFEFEAEPGEYEAQARPSMPPATTAPAAGRGLEPDQRRWILALDRSAMELLPEAKRRRFAQVDWSRVEFPGNNPKNAAARASWPLADELFSAMAVVIPERRVPQSIRSPQSIRYRDVAREVVPVPGQKSRNPRLYPEARDAFVRMREAAAADGVRLLIDSSWRSRQQQAAVSRNQPNPKAAAGSISAHMYGLAVDLRMSVPGLSADVNTRSPEKMARLVRMYRSPVYKWMALRGREFGWYPYRREPWHWEYNPPGFKERFEGAASRAAGHTEFERSDYEFDYGEAEWTRKWGEEAEVSGPIQAGTRTIDKVPLLQKHQSIGPDLILAWNDMQAAPRAVDVVVHLHGYSLRPGTQLHIGRDLKARSGLDWSDPTGRHGTQRRTRPTLALLPRGHFFGGAGGRGYSFPALTAEGGLQQLIDFGLNQLAGTLSIPGLRCARLIVTAHSGGGAPLLRILSSVDPHEVHVFDGLYQNADALVRWAGRRIARDQSALAGGAVPIERYMSEQGGALRVLHRGGTAHHSLPVAEALRRAIPAGSPLRRWYRVERTAVGHVQIPPVYGWRLLVNAAADVPGASPTVAGRARPAARPTARQVAPSSETDFGLRP